MKFAILRPATAIWNVMLYFIILVACGRTHKLIHKKIFEHVYLLHNAYPSFGHDFTSPFSSLTLFHSLTPSIPSLLSHFLSLSFWPCPFRPSQFMWEFVQRSSG